MTRSQNSIAQDAAVAVITSPVGALTLAATDTGLTHLLFSRGATAVPVHGGSVKAARIVRDTERQLGEYFAGKRRTFDLPLAPSGTAFQLAVWRLLRDIPFGVTCSYGDLARRLGKPAAVRAVGLANGANPISIVVPCHRVVGADGKLTGYGGGLPTKRFLLDLEQPTLTGVGRSG
jgi:methylated-DNA-[protein]-cysteine S-methyltransferase